MNLSVNRRFLVLVACGFVPYCANVGLLTRASAQPAAFPASDPDSLGKLLDSTQQRQALVADVIFFQSWRLELRPLEYEGRPDFVQEMLQQRAQIFRSPSQFVMTLAQAGPNLNAERERFIAAYNSNRARYERFLEDIGISPHGKAGQRITNSLFIYANLFLANFGREALIAASRGTYIWPIC